jgi:serine/threonine-protein kinase
MPDEPSADFYKLQEALAGRYSLERELGRGGMGIVYLAREVSLDRPVAIKILPPELAEKPAARERFLDEARTAARLSHPNIVPIFSVDEVGEFVLFAMAYIDGESLGECIRARGPRPPSEVARILSRAWRRAPGRPNRARYRAQRTSSAPKRREARRWDRPATHTPSAWSATTR